MHNLYSNFRKFLKITKSVLKPHLLDDGNIGFYPNPPSVPDLEIIALSVMSEALSIASENLFFSKLRSDLDSSAFLGYKNRMNVQIEFN